MTAIRNAEAIKDEIRSGTGFVIERNSNLVAEGRNATLMKNDKLPTFSWNEQRVKTGKKGGANSFLTESNKCTAYGRLIGDRIDNANARLTN